MRVEALGAKSAIERLDERVVRRLARPGEVERDVVLIRPQIEVAGDELGALIDADRVGMADLSTDAFQRRQFLKFCGLDLSTHQSGVFRGQTKLSKFGNARLLRTYRGGMTSCGGRTKRIPNE